MATGLQGLVALARFYQLAAEPDQLNHEFGQPGAVFTDTEILQAVKALILKAKPLTFSVGSIKPSVLPESANKNLIILISMFWVRKVGLVWSGSVTFKNNHNRSLSLNYFLPLLSLDHV